MCAQRLFFEEERLPERAFGPTANQVLLNQQYVGLSRYEFVMKQLNLTLAELEELNKPVTQRLVACVACGSAVGATGVDSINAPCGHVYHRLVRVVPDPSYAPTAIADSGWFLFSA